MTARSASSACCTAESASPCTRCSSGLDVSPVTRFVADVHLGSLARHLRLPGFDTIRERDIGDEENIAVACDERHIILTGEMGNSQNGRVAQLLGAQH